MSDFAVFDHGSVVILQPVSADAVEWAVEHLPPDAQRWGAKGVAIERRYWADIYDGILADGLSVI